MSTDRTPQTADKYIVRFPDGMRDRIAQAAKQSNRSMNAEVVARLQASFDGPLGAQSEVAQQLADARAQTIATMEFLQASLCEAVAAMYSRLKPLDKKDRILAQANRVAESLLVTASPGDFKMPRAKLMASNRALAEFLDMVDDDRVSYEKKARR